jgi:hypothetical protein
VLLRASHELLDRTMGAVEETMFVIIENVGQLIVYWICRQYGGFWGAAALINAKGGI